MQVFNLISQGTLSGPSGEHWWYATLKAPDQVVDADADFVFSAWKTISERAAPQTISNSHASQE